MDDKVIYVIIGWGLGIFSSLFLFFYTRSWKESDYKQILKTELSSILPALAGANYLLSLVLNLRTMETVKWTISIFNKISGDASVDKIKEGLIKAYQDFESTDIIPYDTEIKKTQSLKEISAPALYDMKPLSLLDIDIQKSVVKIRRKIELINQEIKRYYFYFEKTFDPSCLDVNKIALDYNIEVSQRAVYLKSKEVADLISDLLSTLEK